MNPIIFTLLVLPCVLASDYSLTLSTSIRIGPKAQSIMMLLDAKEYQSILFSNTDRPYSKEILTKTELDIFRDTFEINNVVLLNFSFGVKEDQTNLNNTKISGIIGLGISLEDSYENALLDSMKASQLAQRKVVYLTRTPQSENTFMMKFLVDVNKNETLGYTTCKLTDKNDLESKYHNGWVCDFSHILVSGKNNKNLTWNDTIEMNGRVIFDTTTSYLIGPSEYLDIILDLYNINKTDSCIEFENGFNETLVQCDIKTKIEDMISLYFMLDGYAYEIPATSIFRKVENNKYLLQIKFRKEANNIWTLGYPFIGRYNLSFDFDEHTVGIKGEKPLNFTTEWNQWIVENESFLKKVYNDKTIMIVGAVIGSIILLVILIKIIRTFIKRNGDSNHSELIEEPDRAFK